MDPRQKTNRSRLLTYERPLCKRPLCKHNNPCIYRSRDQMAVLTLTERLTTIAMLNGPSASVLPSLGLVTRTGGSS